MEWPMHLKKIQLKLGTDRYNASLEKNKKIEIKVKRERESAQR